jgi:hypothetical protein
MKFILLVVFLLLPVGVLGQKSVSALLPAHAAALQEYLTQNPELEFLSETALDKQMLRDMRKDFGPQMTPYYRKGDFNHDGLQDFALILVKEGPPKEVEGLSEPYNYEYEMNIVVFNGQRRGGYKAVFRKKIDAPLPCFLYSTFNEKKKRLYFAIYQTDSHFVMTPAGKGYIAEYEPES